MHNDIKTSIISTLARYETEGLSCLSLFEIYRHLNASTNPKQISVLDLHNTLAENPAVKSTAGFYSLSDTNGSFVDNRISASKTASKKIKKAKKITRLLKLIPYVKSVAISGSVSMTSPKPKSDIDFFVISQKNRIWTVRFLTVLLTHIIGQRRYKTTIDNKICLNLYIADEKTVFPIQNIASSHMIAKMLPIYQKDVFGIFLDSNKNWISKFITGFEKNFIVNNSIKDKYSNKNNILISLLETVLAKLMSERMVRKTPLAKPPHLIINDNALVFYYPHSKNMEIMKKYDTTLAFYKNKN